MSASRVVELRIIRHPNRFGHKDQPLNPGGIASIRLFDAKVLDSDSAVAGRQPGLPLGAAPNRVGTTYI